MSRPGERLRALAARIERLAVAPAEVARERVWLRVTSPFFRLLGWRLQIRTAKLRAMLDLLRQIERAAPPTPEPGSGATAPPPRAVSPEQRAALNKALAAALAELDENVAAAERAAIVDGTTAHGPIVGWLTRLHEVAARAAAAAHDPADDARRSIALAPFIDWALTSLAVRPPPGNDKRSDAAAGAAPALMHGGPPAPADTLAPADTAADAADDATRDDVAPRPTAATPAPADASASTPAASAPPQPDSAPSEDQLAEAAADTDPLGDPRLVEIDLAAVDRVLDAARAEMHFLGRRRRLFEAARKLLLDAAAAVPLDPAAVHARGQHIADEIVLANRLEAAGVDPDIGLSHQALSALARGERQRLYATLRASAEIARSAGDVATTSRVQEALHRLDKAARPAPEAEAEHSALEILGEPAVRVIRDAYESARRELAVRKLAPPDPEDETPDREERLGLWDRYLHHEAVLATLSSAISVDGCFEVGGTLAPVRVEEEIRRARVVSHPTQDMVLVASGDVRDVPTAVIDDPRGVILALAEGRLLARKFQRIEQIRTPRTRLVTEARIYVLDGSDSMLMGAGRAAGARARMRDSILLAELATLYRRATARGRSTRVVLFFRYFTKLLGPVMRVESPAEALSAMADVVANPRHGGTDIESALLASFEQIREARAGDPDLARAQIVLVTDGDAAVDESAVRAAREREGTFPIGVSVIALGLENKVLRRLVARQRARGEPAFYHFVSDDDLAAIVEGRRAAGTIVHGAPASSDLDAGPADAAALAVELGSLIEEIDTLARVRSASPAAPPPEPMGTADGDALASLGLTHRETEGERARREARNRDDRALTARFDAWFPPERTPDPAAPAAPSDPETAADEPPPWAGDVDATLVVLTALADVLADLGGTQPERCADAVDLLERLLPDARLSPARYREVVRARPARIAPALAAVRAAVVGSAPPKRAAASPRAASRRPS